MLSERDPISDRLPISALISLAISVTGLSAISTPLLIIFVQITLAVFQLVHLSCWNDIAGSSGMVSVPRTTHPGIVYALLQGLLCQHLFVGHTYLERYLEFCIHCHCRFLYLAVRCTLILCCTISHDKVKQAKSLTFLLRKIWDTQHNRRTSF